ncbi:hypothetical protein FHG64_08445 [Antarcticibacterium flavum]|uniref:Uncharacterized protein n=1 Tax=Antarcticibacterium flavum TaxID=2058175 RepID=A0A5B7X3Z5_9FLAO|nr:MULTISPECIES: hypothetical protein [Antarcticibacterium]MCM4161341.1 hypothetical protein [Antarcticibacterium sp. W02-3]QCY69418.1 hypothetical protein FHG64_08445 [Antarcticibacterium flavum]
MKIFIYILMIIAVAVIGYNFTVLDFENLLAGQSGIALIGILCAACVLVLLGILLTSRAIAKKSKQ